jgi:hypothetical protein
MFKKIKQYYKLRLSLQWTQQPAGSSRAPGAVEAEQVLRLQQCITPAGCVRANGGIKNPIKCQSTAK